ncbi:MAG: T9SS type A sorting domain-containing protein [Crocinitomicaceae bacterium]
MKKSLLLLFSLFIYTAFAQDAARNWTVQVSAVVNPDDPSITLQWLPNATAAEIYYIWKKEKGTVGWGTSVGSVPTGGDLEWTDTDVQLGGSYEYMIQLRTGGSVFAWSYINAGLGVELDPNKGDILLLIDETHADALSDELDTLEMDLYNDGWMVTRHLVDPAITPADLKDEIKTYYNELPNLQSLYLLGNIPVPYSGDLYPDLSFFHKGAWPADLYYGDMFGEWTDTDINTTSATDPRNHNIPGDGKFDQSQVVSAINLQVSRVDFSNLSAFADPEVELLRNYLNKAHEFKTTAYIPTDRGLIDQSALSFHSEGFAQNGFRNFTAFFGPDGVEELDYWTTLNGNDYLWSYGCGDGTYSLANGLNGGSALTTNHIADGYSESTFTMLYGSQFGDWDTPNNLLRASIASGRTLSCSWAGRPNFHYHHMAMGENIGYSGRASQDIYSDYFSLTIGGGAYVTGEGVHVAQLGDPSLRMYYVASPSEVEVVSNDVNADISWSESPDAEIDGYNIYRRPEEGLWVKVNPAIVTETSFSDTMVPGAGDYRYMVKAVKLKTNWSGTFYNESLGAEGSTSFFASLEENTNYAWDVYPNPSDGFFTIQSDVQMERIEVYAPDGKLIRTEQPNNFIEKLTLADVEPGVYFVRVKANNVWKNKRLVIQ